MIHLLQSVIGTPGPLIVEADGNLFIENCVMITERVVEKMYERIKDVDARKMTFTQTTDRSFHISAASSHTNTFHV